MIDLIPNKAKKAIEKAEGKIFVVGGFVRDQMLNLKSKDLDIVITGIPYSKLVTLLSPFGKVDLVGKSFGVIKWTLDGLAEPIDVALPRIEMSTGNGHKEFAVNFDHNLSIEDDLGRRDFTVNAMAIDLATNELIDPFGGKKDLRGNTLRVVSINSFKEDPLRMLRGIQFMARFNLLMRNSTMKSIENNSHRIKHISKDRIGIELGKLFSKGKLLRGALEQMISSGLWIRIFPEISCPIKLIELLPQDINLRLACLFSYGKLLSPNQNRVELADEALTELKLTAAGIDKKKILMLVANSSPNFSLINSDAKRELRKLISKNLNGKPENFFELAILWALISCTIIPKAAVAIACKIVADIEREGQPLTFKALAINGNDLQDKFRLKGKDIGDALECAMGIVLDEPELNTKEDLLSLLKDFRA